jgi:GT2 family glycosyltransferase
MHSLVSVLVLNYKQAAYVPSCLDSLMHQTYTNIEVLFADNASGDGSVDLVRSRYPHVKTLAHPSNLYYAQAHNIAIGASRGEYVLLLNVDIVLQKTFIEEMVHAMELDARVGMVSGKLLRMNKDLQPLDPQVLDSTGLWFSPAIRHFDRGTGEQDHGQYNQLEYIFGPSGAAPLYRRKMLEEIAFEEEYFDEDFVIYREDAELAWRAQLYGWRALYTPLAEGFHVRRVHPGVCRRDLSRDINKHSVKNRFLMRLKNQTRHHAFRFLLPTLWRDLQVIGYVILVERSSLAAFAEIAQKCPRMLKKRAAIAASKRVSDRYVESWFSYEPVSFPYLTTEDTV